MNYNRKYLYKLAGNCITVLALLLFSIVGFEKSSSAQNGAREYVSQSAREIPLVKTVDVLVVGGTTAAIEAAVEASQHGAEVLLVTPKLYLGEDLCATLRLQPEPDRVLKTNLEKQLFQSPKHVSPLNVKATLNQALLDAQVEFLFGSFVTDVFWADENQLAGVVVSNRAGRQAFAAKTVIDATDNAWICRMAGAKAQNWTGGEMEFERTIILPGNNSESPDYETVKLIINMPDLQFSSFAKAEQIARERTYRDGQLRAAESLFYTPPVSILCKKSSHDWKSGSEQDLAFYQPEGLENILVLSGSAAFPRAVADSLLRPGALCEIGAFIGKAASEMADEKTEFGEAYFNKIRTKDLTTGDIQEILVGLRPVHENKLFVAQPETSVPVLANYDVVVVGGGTSGAPAAIAAARMGMKVLVLEYQEGLGGVGTLGLIGKPWHGRDVGFAAEVPFPNDNIEPKMEWYRSEIKKAGGDIWLGVLGCGAFVHKNMVKGAVVATPEGRGVVLADVVIDGTGNADIAIAAGADYMYGEIEKNDVALQGTGLPSRPLVGNYLNTDYLLVDETDMVDVWRTLVSVQNTKNDENVYDIGSLIQNRERRRIVGEFELKYLDQIIGRTFPDVIVFSGSDYDSHGFTSSPFFALLPHDEVSRKENHPAPGGMCYTPYRCLIPKKLDGILVTGLGISMERDASAMVRMQLDLANQGYAAGVAASLAITSDKQLREINMKEFQQLLVEKGNLPDSVMNLKDSFPMPKKTIRQAVEDYGVATNPTEAGRPLAIILTHHKRALPMVNKAFRRAIGKQKLQYARVLGMCGESDGTEILRAELENFSGWDEKIFQGFMADYAHLPTAIDGLILALGNSGDKSVLPVLLKLVDQLDTTVTLSHHRSLALALEKIADPTAAKPLAELLQKPGMQGHVMLTIDDAMTDLSNDGRGMNGKAPLPKRTKAFREIIIARALYNCGDYNDIGKKILKTYEHDWRGLFARHAESILTVK